MKKGFESPEEIDGFDELAPEDREKFTKAWEENHVADEDVPESARVPIEYNSDGDEIEVRLPLTLTLLFELTVLLYVHILRLNQNLDLKPNLTRDLSKKSLMENLILELLKRKIKRKKT